MARPDDLKYTETHEWVRANKKGEASIGITDYAVRQLSDLVHLELPKVGDSLEQGAPFGEIESVKTVADLVAPVSGQVTAINQQAVEDLDLLKEGPYDDGWLIKVKVSDPGELDSLLSSKEYQEFLEQSQEEEEEEKEEAEGKEEDEVDEDDFM